MTRTFTWLLFFTVTLVFGQRKYREVLEHIDELTPGEEMTVLREYIDGDPDHPNANFRLAMLHEKYYRSSDPLLKYASLMAHAKESLLRYTKAKQLITEAEVRSNNESYSTIFFKRTDPKNKPPVIDFTAIANKITAGYDSANLILTKLPPINRAFTKSVNHYDHAVKLFAQINNGYNTEEDIYMLYNDALDKRMEELKSFYDSSLYYFDRYLSLIKDFPLGNYRQRYTISSIKTYRLDGLINRMTFLESEVKLWDYALWVDHIRQTFNTTVLPIRRQLERNEEKLNEVLTKLGPGEREISTFHPEKDLIFNLNNFDKNSLAIALLRYKELKQNWILKSNTVLLDSSRDHRLDLYSDLIQLNRIGDSLRNQVEQRVTPINVSKHSAYLEKYYGGQDGLMKMLGKESEWIDQTFTRYQGILVKNLLELSMLEEPFKGKFLKIGSNNIPLFVSQNAPEVPDNPGLITTVRQKSPDGSLYLAGIFRSNKKPNNRVAYVAKINPDLKNGWFKEFNFPVDSGIVDSHNKVAIMELTKEGVAAMITSRHMSRDDRVNTLVYFNEKGETKFRARLTESQYPRKIIYRESNDLFIVTFKGKAELENFNEEETIKVMSLNSIGDILWDRELRLRGTLQDGIQVRDGFILIGNFTGIRDGSGRLISTASAKISNPYLVKLSEKGNLIQVRPILSNRSVCITRVEKINDGSINLLGYEIPMDALQDNQPLTGTPKHMMVNHDLKTICSNF